MTLREKIGQRLVGGFPGKEMSEEFIELVKDYKVSNVILFQHNVESKEQLSRLCRDIQTLVRKETGHGALICIDQEGGTVTRLPEDAVNVPGAMALAATGSEENAYRAARITAGELKALGVNFNLAPTADVNNNPDNPIIGVRSFSDKPEVARGYVVAAVKGYADGGVLSSIKHFPGHGDTSMDSHVSLPMIDKSMEELEAMELIPFKAAIEAGCPTVMTTHILFPQLESEEIPATMSRTIITGLLKEKLGFQGIVISDCMEMDAISKYYGTVRGVVEAMAAGVDLVLVSHTAKTLKDVAEAVYAAAEEGRLSMEEMDASAQKILRCKEIYCIEPTGEAGTPQAMAEAAALRSRTITLYQGQIPPMGDNPVFLGCAGYRSGFVSNQKSGEDTFAGYMASRFGGTALVTEKDPDSDAVRTAVEAAKGHSAIFVNTYNGHLSPGQLTLVHELTGLGIPMAVIALRNPYDLRNLPQSVAAIAAWDYSRPTLEALAPILSGEQAAEGKMPIAL
ncbi:MAG: glycoside hydrolase family 3 protein [Lachnospiraceae bacterium]|jgi:beta-N-acetylhexosaminidase|nr:glycoside hydrolase family 3 protein [Lachnospiraceae bacterium]